MGELVAVLGSVTPPGRLASAVQAALAGAAGFDAGVSTRLLDLGALKVAYADGRPPEQYGDDTATVVSAIAGAEAVLLASPVYRASYTGALKNLLDHVPVEGLRDKPVGIIAMGATPHHYLGVDRHLRDVLSWFGALVAPNSVYLASADFSEGKLTERALAELHELVGAVLKLRAVGALGPAPLAARRG